MNTRLLLPLLALLLPCAPLRAEDKFLLRQHWEPGKVYLFETNTDMEMTMPAGPALPGLAGGQTTTMIQEMEISVRKEPGSERKLLDMKLVGMKAMMNIGGELKTFDSTDPSMSEPQFQQLFGAMLTNGATLIYDKDDKFVEAVLPKEDTSTPIGEMRGPDRAQFGEMMRGSVDFGLPPEALAIGGTYATEKKMGMAPMGSMNTKVKGRLDSIVTHEGRKHVKVLSDGSMEMPDLPPEAQGVIGKMPDMKLTTEILFDLERKAITRSTTKNEMKMNTGQVQMTMKQTSITTLKSMKDAPTTPASKPASPASK